MIDDIKNKAVWYWQDSLAKFFPTSKGPTNCEIIMYEAGYKQAIEDTKETSGKDKDNKN